MAAALIGLPPATALGSLVGVADAVAVVDAEVVGVGEDASGAAQADSRKAATIGRYGRITPILAYTWGHDVFPPRVVVPDPALAGARSAPATTRGQNPPRS